jgi:hypothetical protein
MHLESRAEKFVFAARHRPTAGGFVIALLTERTVHFDRNDMPCSSNKTEARSLVRATGGALVISRCYGQANPRD